MSHEVTGTRDVTFDLVSVLYHALEAADTCARYLGDAKQEGKTELANFFEQVISANRKIADDAKTFLRERFEQSANVPVKEEGMIDKMSADSFPASDPPANY